MSYILDSLKKSDKERRDSNNQEGVQPLFEYTPDFVVKKRNKNSAFRIIFWMLLLALCAAAIWMIVHFPGEPSAQEVPEVKEDVVEIRELPAPIVKEIKPAPSVVALYESQEKIHIAKPNKEVDSKKAIEPKKAVKSDAAPSTEQDGIASIYDLSGVARNSIPSIRYGAHVYATDNRSGFVILNGAKHHAQSRMENGVFVERVDKNAVILSYQGRVFSLPAMVNWNAP